MRSGRPAILTRIVSTPTPEQRLDVGEPEPARVPPTPAGRPRSPSPLETAVQEAVQRWAAGDGRDDMRPVKVRAFREVWRVTVAGRGAYLKWFPTDRLTWRERLKRRLGGAPALREYRNLLVLQELRLPSPRAVALLRGLRREGRVGDAVLTWAVEPSEPLDELLNRCRREATALPQRRAWLEAVLGLLEKLARSGLGHDDLHFGNLLHAPTPQSPHGLVLLDAYALHPGRLTLHDLLVLGYSAQAHATRTELLRGWRRLLAATPGGVRGVMGSRRSLPPLANAVTRRQWRKAVERMCRPGSGGCEAVEWVAPDGGLYRGLCFTRQRFPHRHSVASGLTLSSAEWLREWPRLWEQLVAETLEPLKRSASGDVWGGEVVLTGVPVEVVVKRAYRRYAYRYVTELGRGTRTWRAWWKSWALLARDIPTAWPLLMLQRRRLGVVTDQLIVFERVPGRQLDRTDLARLSVDERERLFRRVGRLLRRIDDTDLVHFDTKASNILIRPDPVLGPGPVLVDVDGVRTYSWRGEGLRRLIQSMREHHPDFTDDDAESLRRGYAPWAKFASGSQGSRPTR